MPRRSVDQGGKPFEFRTGVGGLPQLGGMFRSGDPATIPPHKFHLLVNMRRTPGGTITRPGLALEFDTGVQECIDGLTEDAGEQGGALMLYPGAESRPGNGSPNFVPATFRAIFPDSSVDYSEFAFAVYGPASAVRGNQSPVLAYSTLGGGYMGPTFLSRPFVFRGQSVQFAMVDRSGTDTVALLGINLAPRSFLQASDCWRDTARPNDGTTPSCPGLAGDPTPPGLNDPPLWPFQHPIGSVGVLAYFDNPFPAGGAWTPDAADVIDQILTRQERVDDVLTGTSGVSEVLYFVARQDVAGPIRKRFLIRWDGALQTTEAITIPDDLPVALSEQAYGPYLGSAGPNASATDWAAFKTEAGAWSIIGGVGWTLGAAQGDRDTAFFLPRALSWGGKGHLITYGEYRCSVVTFGDYVVCSPQAATEFPQLLASASCSPLRSCELSDPPVVWDALVSGLFCYVLGRGGDRRLYVGSFLTPLFSVPPFANGVKLSDTPGAPSDTTPELWIQSSGGRVYVGGRFTGFNPETQAADVDHHGVYDVTDPTAVFNVYRVEETEQLEDSGEGGHQAERYSRGALPAVPNDDTGGQGFQAS